MSEQQIRADSRRSRATAARAAYLGKTPQKTKPAPSRPPKQQNPTPAAPTTTPPVYDPNTPYPSSPSVNPYGIKWNMAKTPSKLYIKDPAFRQAEAIAGVAIQAGANMNQAMAKVYESMPKATPYLKTYVAEFERNMADVFNTDPYECFEDMACFYDRSIDQTPAGRVHLDSPYYTPIKGSPTKRSSKTRNELIADQYRKQGGL